MRKLSIPFIVLLIAFSVVIGGCGSGSSAEGPLPTRTPLPTFTPTPPVVVTPVDPSLAATAQAEAAQQASQPAQTDQAATDSGQAQADTPTPEPATPTPQPASPGVVVNSNMNVRSGPGTNFNVVGQANQGTRYNVTGRNNDASWYQIDFNGQSGWVFANLVTAEAVETVAVAANIPAPPPTNTPPPPPTNTPVPPPTAPPAPRYEFNVAVVGRCDRQPAGTWFEGKTYKNGQPTSGYNVVFSYAPDGPWVTQPAITGPHDGYPNWDAGYYSHIVSAAGPIAGTWYVWIVDGAGGRISEMANFTSTGPGEGCNQAVVDFDSR